MRYGLIGEKLGHSYSKIIHNKLADYPYDLIPLSKEEFHRFMQEKAFTALNVTIPYKQDVIPYLDYMDTNAGNIGAVNTIVNRDGKLYGYNTDFYGFEYMLLHHRIAIEDKKVLVLGDGGAAKAVRAVLQHQKAGQVLTVSRKVSENTVNYQTCYHQHTDADLIVNTTPVGMYPDNDAIPLDLTDFKKCKVVVDLIYNPIKTKLALQAESMGMQAITGLEMLIAQAKQAVEYFLDTRIDESVIDDIYQEMRKDLYTN